MVLGIALTGDKMKQMTEIRRYLLLSLAEVLAVVFVYGLIFHEHFVTVWKQEGVAWIVLSIALVAFGNYVFFRFQAKRRQKIQEMLLEKVVELKENHPSRHLLLTKDDEYYNLAQQINALQTRQRELKRKYKQQDRDYLTLLQSLKDGVIVFDQHKRVVLYNHVIRRNLESTTELTGKLFYQVFENAQLLNFIEETYQTKTDQEMLWSRKVGNKTEWFEVQIIYVSLSKHHYSVMCIFNNVTKAKQLEETQREFMANASHELKTPLTAIQGFSETLLSGALDDKKTAREFVKVIYEQSQQLNELIEDISALAKDGDVYDLNFEEVELNALCQKVLTGYQMQINEKNLTVETAIDPKLVVYSDRHYLQQIISNLIQNAIRYNVEAGKIKLSATKKSSSWELRVYNTGQTLDAEAKEKVFERFYRADSSRSTNGSGLGLAIVKEAVVTLSGEISVLSPYENGTCFKLEFPLFYN